MVGLAVLGAVAFVFAPSGHVPTKSAPQEPEAEPAPEKQAPPSSRIAPLDRLAPARAQAQAWNRDAVLVSMHAEPVVVSAVDLTNGGYVEFVFGVPGASFGTTASVGPSRFLVRVDADGSHSRKLNAAPARAALEPTCSMEEAVSKLRASGVADQTPLAVDFMVSPRHEKAVWTLTPLEGDRTPRTLDGVTCAFVVR